MNAPRLSIIPAGAVTDRTLEPRDLQVLCLLGRHTDKAGWCVRSQVRMAQEIDCSRGSLQNSLDRLVTAGWVEKKRRDTEVEEAGKHPSRSYAYRVLLDRDDYTFENATRDADDGDAESYAETASEEGGCQPVGTLANLEQHGGANTYIGTGANTYVGTNNAPLERPPSERERDARARGKKEKFKRAFKSRWPDVATDSQQRLDYALEGLNDDEEVACLAGIDPFLAAMKRKGRTNVPSSVTYVEEKRWTLLDQPEAKAPGLQMYPRGSAEAKAIEALHDLVGRSSAFRTIWRAGDGSVNFPKPMTPQLRALGELPPRNEWPSLTIQQSAAWNRFFREFFDGGIVLQMLREGSQAPHAWPPKVDGTWSPIGPPDTLLSDQDVKDMEDFK